MTFTLVISAANDNGHVYATVHGFTLATQHRHTCSLHSPTCQPKSNKVVRPPHAHRAPVWVPVCMPAFVWAPPETASQVDALLLSVQLSEEKRSYPREKITP